MYIICIFVNSQNEIFKRSQLVEMKNSSILAIQNEEIKVKISGES